MDVSVILLTYNQEAYVGQAIASVMAQQCSCRYELIVGDDGSSDGTRAVCREWQEKYPDRIVLQFNEHNKGIIRNYFDCMALARGRYIGDCGGDDWWTDPHKLQREFDILEAHPEVSVVYGNYQDYIQASGELRPHNTDLDGDVFRPDDFGRAAAARHLCRKYRPEVVLSAACYRKDIVWKVYQARPELFLQEGYKAEDIPVTALLLNAGPAWYIHRNHLAYRVLSESVSHTSDRAAYYRFAALCLCQTVDTALYLGLSADDLNPWLRNTYADYLHFAWLSRDRSLADRLYAAVRKMGYHPSPKNEFKRLMLCVLKKRLPR